MSVSYEQAQRLQLFRELFEHREGYVCVASSEVDGSRFQQRFFEWPDKEFEIHRYVDTVQQTKNIWFCVNLLSKPQRVKENCLDGNLVWADLDECAPSEITPSPSIIIESSPGRFQAVWRCDRELAPEEAEDFSRRLAYAYNSNGVDPSGWDLTQLLRFPYTFNLKYQERPQVTVAFAETLVPASIFEAFEETPLPKEYVELDSSIPAPQDVHEILVKHAGSLRENHFERQYDFTPSDADDWSSLLWRLIHTCFDAGLTPEEAFTVAEASSVNKYKRDGRPMRYLWRDVRKAHAQRSKFTGVVSSGDLFEMPELIPGEKYNLSKSFVDEYREWGEASTDASSQYHDLSAYILLSALLADSLKLETNYGTLRPNLWGLILGDTTLTRKTTSMGMARDIITSVDKDIVCATDASVEGLLSSLQLRPGRSSMFYRDEVSGFFHSFQKKEYLAGMPEMLTQLYDGGFFARRLRKELITVQDPVFIFFGGGILEKVQVILDESFVLSGFLPRFLIVSGETDLSRLRRTGPPTSHGLELRQKVYAKATELYQIYGSAGIDILGVPKQGALHVPEPIEAILSESAWKIYGEVEMRMVEAASTSNRRIVLLPTFERMSRSLLKMAVLNAAVRQQPSEAYIGVTDEDVLRAAKYIQIWGNYSINLLHRLGSTVLQRQLTSILAVIEQFPGIMRVEIMRRFDLTKFQMNEVEGTLEDRGQIKVEKRGKGSFYYPLA